jgi:hypothetical protein
MAKCEVCGNDYYLSFEVVTAGETHVFDCFECAIHSLAPVCERCGCRIIGHGVEADNTFFCSAHCAGESGVKGAKDHVRANESSQTVG